MGMALEDLRLPRPAIDALPATWSEYLRLFDLPATLIAGSDHAAFHVLVARVDGEGASAALAFDLDGDCGIYNVGTLAHARRRGLGTAVTVAQLHDAIARGRRTASIQATPMAERVYAAIGFRDLGRFVEYVPEPYAVKPASSPSAAVSKRATSP
jgi:ribosomal protein S18 acetylase RimI-like enzyme